MRVYLGNAVRVAVPDGFVLTRRQTSSGPREGLLACVDLEQYDFAPGSKSLIRATEGTVPERVPPAPRYAPARRWNAARDDAHRRP